MRSYYKKLFLLSERRTLTEEVMDKDVVTDEQAAGEIYKMYAGNESGDRGRETSGPYWDMEVNKISSAISKISKGKQWHGTS